MELRVLSRQVERLLSQNNVQLCECPADGAQFATRFNKHTAEKTGMLGEVGLHAFPLKSEVGYAVALHELGHVLSPTQRIQKASDDLAVQLNDRTMYSDNFLWNELDAWHWARCNALDWTYRMDREEQRCLQSYAGGLRWNDLGLASHFGGTLKLDAWHNQMGM